ncbi:hypothetical protein V6O07_05045, partial [Arthrospira platensis SPKY2]
LLSVGSGFSVDGSGDITSIRGVTYSWPNAQAIAPNYVLVNDGAGNLSWTTVSGVGGLTGSGSANFISLWNGTSSLGVSPLYVSGSNIGLGNTSPLATLDITGNVRIQTLLGNSSNTVVVSDGSNILSSRIIDSRVWGSSLLDGSGSANFVSRFIDADTLGIGSIYDTGTFVGIGNTSPTSLLSVGSGFSVDGSGDITSIRGVTYSWPNAQAIAPNYVLVNDGSGNLSWTTVSGVG